MQLLAIICLMSFSNKIPNLKLFSPGLNLLHSINWSYLSGLKQNDSYNFQNDGVRNFCPVEKPQMI